MCFEPADETTVTDDGNHWLVSATFLEHLVLLGNFLASRLDDIAANGVVQVVIDVNDGSVVHDKPPMSDPPTYLPFLIRSVHPKGEWNPKLRY